MPCIPLSEAQSFTLGVRRRGVDAPVFGEEERRGGRELRKVEKRWPVDSVVCQAKAGFWRPDKSQYFLFTGSESHLEALL